MQIPDPLRTPIAALVAAVLLVAGGGAAIAAVAAEVVAPTLAEAPSDAAPGAPGVTGAPTGPAMGHGHGGPSHAGHPAALALADPAAATHVAVASGDWSSSTTWADGQVPSEGSHVHIPAGIAVTIDGRLAPAIKTIGVDGTLRFAPEVDTELRVDTLVTTPQGALEVGTPERPIAADVVASIVFADDGPIDRTVDPSLLSRGALLHGTTVVEGAEVTHRTTVTAFPRAGDRAIEVAGDLTGWDAGDEIVITGTDGPTSDEVRTIATVDGSTVRFTEPLGLDHVPPAADLDLYVANLTRNVRFSSENPQIDRRGHLMVMHTLDARIRGARFTDMGRTDKSIELDDIDFGDIEPGAVDWDGSFETLGGTNVRGRYSVHVHRGGADPRSTPAVIADSVVTGDPGWAFTNHSSHVDFVRNVAYDNAGAGFFTEAGDETGRWIDNIAIRTVMPTFELDDAGAIDPDLRAGRQDFGVDGDGFWLQGNRVDLIGNVAAGSSAHGIIWWSESLAEADLGQVAMVDVATLPNPSLITDRDRLQVWWAPLGEVRDNVSYGAVVGVRARYIHGASYLEDPNPPSAAYIDSLRPVIDGIVTWDVRDGVLMNYNERLTLRNIRAIGIAEPFRHNYGHTAAVGVGMDLGNDATFGPGAIENVDLQGFEVGLITPRHGRWTIDGLTTSATTDVLIHSPLHTERSLDLTNLTFAPLDGTALAGRDGGRRNVVLAYDYAGDGDGVDPSTAGEEPDGHGALLADRVTWDGRGLYSPAQAADVVVADQDLTNAELQAQRGTSAGGALLPADARIDPRVVNGLVGSPAPVPTITHQPGAGAIGGDDESEEGGVDHGDDGDDDGDDGDEHDEDGDHDGRGDESIDDIVEELAAEVAALLAQLDTEQSAALDEWCREGDDPMEPLTVACVISEHPELGGEPDADAEIDDLDELDDPEEAVELLEDLVFDAVDRIEELDGDGDGQQPTDRCNGGGSEATEPPDLACLLLTILHGDDDDE